MAVATASMVMLALGVSAMSGLSRVVREPAALNASMLRAMSHVWFDPAVRNSFSAMQLELKCCGVHSYSDWYQYRRSIPPACCGNTCNGKRCEQCTVPLYTTGCLCPALSELRNFSNSLSILASAIVLILVSATF
ncbi:Tetraspanin [Operophtera brumata]|uniref:Tetraspanin n=1 Tax=Operophtera brumata TaxID=104452 RepID=A0A0L7LBJ3_OPEBR|nr:Tetraspanin [Operophtera brumata]